jgi:hypothetical protein
MRREQADGEEVNRWERSKDRKDILKKWKGSKDEKNLKQKMIKM